MIRQSISVSVIPDETNPIRYTLWLSSQGWEEHHPVVTRQINLGQFDALPWEVSPRSFEEWTDGMLGLMKAAVRQRLGKHEPESISGAGAYAEKASETLSQDM